MKTKSTPIASIVTFPVNKFRSYPAEIGSSAPLNHALPARRVEFPQEATITAPEVVTPWTESEYWKTWNASAAPPRDALAKDFVQLVRETLGGNQVLQ
jgi:hypothetical protein